VHKQDRCTTSRFVAFSGDLQRDHPLCGAALRNAWIPVLRIVIKTERAHVPPIAEPNSTVADTPFPGRGWKPCVFQIPRTKTCVPSR